MAIYPTLFLLYLGRVAPGLAASPLTIGLLFIATAAACNLASAGAVGDQSAVMTVLLLAPFAILAVLALVLHPTTAPSSVPAEAGAPRDFSGALLVAMWNYTGWDNASTVAAEVEHPQRTYPLAVLTAVALIALNYVLPLAAMAIAGVDPSSWETGSWVDVARVYGGAPLAFAVVVGGMVSAFGMYNSLCLSYSRLPVALADDGYLPAFFARRLRSGSPWVAVIACSLAWTLSLGLTFDRLISLDILLYGTSLLLEFIALAVLRVREPDLPRPFRVPGRGMVGGGDARGGADDLARRRAGEEFRGADLRGERGRFRGRRDGAGVGRVCRERALRARSRGGAAEERLIAHQIDRSGSLSRQPARRRIRIPLHGDLEPPDFTGAEGRDERTEMPTKKTTRPKKTPPKNARGPAPGTPPSWRWPRRPARSQRWRA